MPGNLSPTNSLNAVRVALNRGKTQCRIMLASGVEFDFTIDNVTEDGLIGKRTHLPQTAAVVFFDAVALIEFPA